MSGNCATGMRSSESTPASVITMAMTIASRGRSTKTAEIMPLWTRRFRCGRRRRGGTGVYLDAWPHALDALEHDRFAFLEASHDDRGGRGRLAELDAALLDVVLAVDDIDVVALLIGQYRGTRDRQRFHRLSAFDQRRDKF